MAVSEERQVPPRRRFDVADAAPLVLDAHLKVTGWTADAERLLGYRPAEVVGHHVVDLLLPEDAARISERAERCRGVGGWAGLLSALHRDGHAVRVMVRAIPVREDAAPTRWVVLLADLADGPGWNMSRSVLERMNAGSPVGIAIVDTELRFVWSNTALEQFGVARRSVDWDADSPMCSRGSTPRPWRRGCARCCGAVSRWSDSSMWAAYGPRRIARPRTPCRSSGSTTTTAIR